jgi:hypothetical protein
MSLLAFPFQRFVLVVDKAGFGDPGPTMEAFDPFVMPCFKSQGLDMAGQRAETRRPRAMGMLVVVIAKEIRHSARLSDGRSTSAQLGEVRLQLAQYLPCLLQARQLHATKSIGTRPNQARDCLVSIGKTSLNIGPKLYQ